MFSVNRVAPSISAVEENQNNEGEEKSYRGFDKPEELLRNLSPLLSSLKIFGIYFENEFEVRMQTITEKIKRYAHRLYTMIVLLILWANVIRTLAVFNQNEQFGSILAFKLEMLSFSSLGAILQTVAFSACQQKQFIKIFKDLSRFELDMDAIRKRTIRLTITFWVGMCSNVIVVVYQSFIYDGPATIVSLSLIQPLNIFFEKEPVVIICLKLFSIVWSTYTFVSITGALSVYLSIALILRQEFLKIKLKLKNLQLVTIHDSSESLEELSFSNKSKWKSDFGKLRQSHQRLSNIVENADKFIGMWNGCCILDQIIVGILVLYGVCFYPEYSQSGLVFVNVIFILCSVSTLAFSAGSAIVVNSAVSEIRDNTPGRERIRLYDEDYKQIYETTLLTFGLVFSPTIPD